MNSSYNTYINFQKLHDEISIIKRIPQNERFNNGNDTISDFFSRYSAFYTDAPILRKLINDDIGLNTFGEVITPQTIKLNKDIESHLFEKKNPFSILSQNFITNKNNEHNYPFNNNIYKNDSIDNNDVNIQDDLSINLSKNKKTIKNHIPLHKSTLTFKNAIESDIKNIEDTKQEL